MSVLNAKANTTIAFTDGACKGNPGAGGWGAYLVFADGQTQAWCGGAADTTNNRMELMGAIQALKNSPEETLIEIWTDSSYVKNGITQWIDGWKQKGWKTASKKPVANQDLWQQLDSLRQSRPVSWHWVKGHAGHEGNEKADELANLGVERILQGLSEPFQSEGSSNDSVSSTQASDGVEPLKKNSDNPTKTLINPGLVEDTATISSSPTATEVDATNEDWLLTDPLGLGLMDDDLEAAVIAEDSNSNYDLSANFSSLEPPNNDSHPTDDFNQLNDQNNLNSINESSTLADASVMPSPDAIPPINSDHMSSNTTTDATTPMSNITTPNPEAEMSHQQQPSDSEIKFDGDTSRANPHFVPLLPDPIHRHENARQLIMDTETTGLDATQGDRVIEVGIVELIGRKFTGEKLHVYINPERGMDEDAIRIHGISEAFLQDKPKFAEVAQKLFDFMDGAEVIAHNAPFDIGFLTMEFDKVGLKGFADRVTVTDSLVMAKQQYPGQRNTLDALVKRLNVGKQDRTFHGALLDAEILAEVYLAMTGGQVALAIDEDTQSEGSGSHTDFAHLASKLISASTDVSAHQTWFDSLKEEYPELKRVWGSDI